ncbi:flagellar hook-associated protein FlgL [Sphingomonas sp. HMP6]|uniref:flagellar hook-associated protein FlgL n=1 Tax=Sphingomonas sp. HMP6 TaxID=1517551 RepID=UPI001596EC3C|nr:flagellar hook-associated protein FlgL [Sphingomonas sp. HMP6]BCA59779.1 flagellar hook protein FlgL [Sphingomonas sp. HMP6]
MQIGTNQFYNKNATQLGKLATQADTINTQIATGKKISAPSQDVVAYNRLSAIKQTNADSKAYASNVSLAQSLLQQSDTTLTSIGNQLQRAAELTTQAANGTLNDANRKTIAIELQSIRDDLVSLAGTTDARGQPLFGTASGGPAVVQAVDGTVSFGGTGEISAIPVADGTDIQATDSAQRVFGNLPGGGGTTDVFAVLSSLISALNAGGNVSAATGAAADGLKAALTQVSNVQGSVGARAARLDIVASQATDAAAARETDRVGLEDTDISTAITELQKTMTVLQATQASFTKLGQLSLFDYLR